MKKIQKIDLRLVVGIVFFLFLSGCLVALVNDSVLEEKVYAKLEKEKDRVTLKENAYVISLSDSEEDHTVLEQNKLDNQRIEELQYMVNHTFSSAKGVFVLGTSLLSKSDTERKCIPAFRKAGNVYWHYNMKNIGYYHDDDNCSQIQFVNDTVGNRKEFRVYGDGKYDKNYMPYYFMNMNGEKVTYQKGKQKYVITDKDGQEKSIYAKNDGSVRIRSTSKYNVSYYDFDSFYTKIKAYERAKYQDTDEFTNAVIFIQDANSATDYSSTDNVTQELADYYIDVLGTIENQATIPTFSKIQKLGMVLSGVLFIGVMILFFAEWIGILAYGLLMGISVLAEVLLFDQNICYVPMVDFWIMVSGSFLPLIVLKNYLIKVSARNLPIDAVIRFTNNIVNIEHSVSYSEYLIKNRSEIEEDISANLLLPVMDRNSFLLQELAAENHRNKKFVENEFWKEQSITSSVSQARSNLFQGVKYIAFVPLPVFDVESEVSTYTAIGLKKKLRPQNASYISMMLFSMYIYFKAQHERGEHQRMYFSMLSLMISVIDAKDPVTAGHSQRVANISKDIGIWLKLSKNEQFDLEFTALLHDIGKIGVSDYVLNKPSVYTQNDFEQMKYHTIRGAEMLSEVGISEEIIDGVRHHHERIDGKGYPDGLKGDQLTLFAKIIKIADVFDALTSKRQYKDAWEIGKALNIIYRGRGTEFDSDIADVFIEHMSPPGWIPPVNEQNIAPVSNPNIEKVAKIARDFYGKYAKYLTESYELQSHRADSVSFFSEKGFMNYDWGETFNNATFLEEKPVIIAYEKESKSLIFGQNCKRDGVNHIYYYFFKGFINMGIYLLMDSYVKEIKSQLEEKYGEPHIVDGQTMVYEGKKLRIVFYRTENDQCFLFYVSDYMCANYIFK